MLCIIHFNKQMNLHILIHFFINNFMIVVSIRFFNEFLMSNERHIAIEIKDEYVNTMSKIYFSYFKTYVTKIGKLQVGAAKLRR